MQPKSTINKNKGSVPKVHACKEYRYDGSKIQKKERHSFLS